MARPEKPLPEGSDPHIDAARWLRGLRDRAGLTNRQLAQQLGMSESTISRAMAGRGSNALVRLLFVMTFMCGGSIEESQNLMGRLSRRRRAHLQQPIEGILGCDPDLITTPAELIRGMRVLRIHAGQPSLAELKRRSPNRTLAPTTINEILLGQRLPSALVLARFVIACGVVTPESDRWARAWQRVMFSQQQSGWKSKAPFSRMIRFQLVEMEANVGSAFSAPFQEAHEEINGHLAGSSDHD
ncbi:helix-turn-helix transcriptional regulator [Streptomyces sp. NEAU-YJ-81]|uniref:helix-turn-helix domain-containing protein n=1 Tax=Streptomyces sp. NEAU-YJ-81 TaxID=2820288 RepID=UPI001ABC25A1|nr:helix-turn-helix transcriptional regulator [Streptomyces sp. NEAU-YJ-81]MBO3673536.1 helix-turn-helix domain-containing protein [Streptomyces sp. NEAU-YJ-81]